VHRKTVAVRDVPESKFASTCSQAYLNLSGSLAPDGLLSRAKNEQETLERSLHEPRHMFGDSTQDIFNLSRPISSARILLKVDTSMGPVRISGLSGLRGPADLRRGVPGKDFKELTHKHVRVFPM
jgi:hypothetical protein